MGMVWFDGGASANGTQRYNRHATRDSGVLWRNNMLDLGHVQHSVLRDTAGYAATATPCSSSSYSTSSPKATRVYVVACPCLFGTPNSCLEKRRKMTSGTEEVFSSCTWLRRLLLTLRCTAKTNRAFGYAGLTPLCESAREICVNPPQKERGTRMFSRKEKRTRNLYLEPYIYLPGEAKSHPAKLASAGREPLDNPRPTPSRHACSAVDRVEPPQLTVVDEDVRAAARPLVGLDGCSLDVVGARQIDGDEVGLVDGELLLLEDGEEQVELLAAPREDHNRGSGLELNGKQYGQGSTKHSRCCAGTAPFFMRVKS